MPLIKVEKEVQKEKRNISFEKEVMKDLELYAVLLGKEANDSDIINLIVNEGMKFFLKKDKDFIDYKMKNDRQKIDLENNYIDQIKISSGANRTEQ